MLTADGVLAYVIRLYFQRMLSKSHRTSPSTGHLFCQLHDLASPFKFFLFRTRIRLCLLMLFSFSRISWVGVYI
uniref:Uncharacterized protein n=1 Tax=Anguilla anguilla TaxID=7936 RepID=A0A0E9Q8F1_ANGAN